MKALTPSGTSSAAASTPRGSVSRRARVTRVHGRPAPRVPAAGSLPWGGMGRIDERLTQLGLTLPAPRAPLANYVPARRVGDLVYTAGQVSGSAEQEIKGKLGADLTVDQGRDAAR